MKTLFVLGTFVVFMAGCGNSPTGNSPNSAKVPSTPPQMAETANPTPSAIAVPSETMPAGSRVDKMQSVRFDGATLPAGWLWIDPDAGFSPTPHEFKDAVITITIPTAKDLYGQNRTAPRLVKPIEGDFQIETHVKFDPKMDYQGAGLLIYKDEDNYIRLERSFGGVGGEGSGIRLDLRKGGEYTSLATPVDIPTSLTEVDLKLIRRLNVFSAFWRSDEDGEWRLIEDVSTDYGDTVLAGVIGCNTAEPIKAVFSNIRLMPQPVTRPY